MYLYTLLTVFAGLALLILGWFTRKADGSSTESTLSRSRWMIIGGVAAIVLGLLDYLKG